MVWSHMELWSWDAPSKQSYLKAEKLGFCVRASTSHWTWAASQPIKGAMNWASQLLLAQANFSGGIQLRLNVFHCSQQVKGWMSQFWNSGCLHRALSIHYKHHFIFPVFIRIYCTHRYLINNKNNIVSATKTLLKGWRVERVEGSRVANTGKLCNEICNKYLKGTLSIYSSQNPRDKITRFSN